jgi:hypothetical protein
LATVIGKAAAQANNPDGLNLLSQYSNRQHLHMKKTTFLVTRILQNKAKIIIKCSSSRSGSGPKTLTLLEVNP